MKRTKKKSVILVGIIGGIILSLWAVSVSDKDHIAQAINEQESKTLENDREKEQVVPAPAMAMKVPSGYPYKSTWKVEEIAREVGMDPVRLAELNNMTITDIVYAGQTFVIEPYTAVNTVLVSWYGPGFQGNRMANGQRFNMYDESIVAHKFLPFGTVVRLTRIDNGKSVIVTVKDRGPFVSGRHFDLSFAAARLLGMINDGIAECRVEILDWPH